MKKILVASDMTSRSDRAMERAVQLATQHGAKLVVTHVIDDDLPSQVVSQMRQTAEETLGAILSSDHAPKDAEIRIETGETVETISQTAKDIDADLVILGMHKPRLFWDMFSGTTMERLVRAQSRPVLLVRDPVTGPYKSVLCGIDLSPSCLAAGKAALEMVPEAKFATFHAVHIPYRGMLAPEASEKQLAPFVKDANAELDKWWESSAIPKGLPKPTVTPSSVQDAFQGAMEESEADLFALGAHGRMPLSPTLLGGFTEYQIRNPRTDLLIVRD
ncbi:universal stress protein [Celeribacter halophilus]|uniref:universal stress protein n=1 Tax=Celeribacter halophilus TaxID=576117 RepID=UPI002FD604ED